MNERYSKYIPHFPHPKQNIFLSLRCQEAFFGGGAGGGKTDALLMAALQYVHVPNYSALILMRTFQQLALPKALMDRAHEWLDDTDAEWLQYKKRWTFPSGAKLTFGYLENEDDKLNYKSAEFHYVAFDEVTSFTQTQYIYFYSRTRRLEGSTVPIRIRSAGNPEGIGFDWVRDRMIINGKKNGIVFIPSLLEDNPSLDIDEYEKSMSHLDKITFEKLRHGDWSIRKPGKILKSIWLEIVDAVPVDCLWIRFWDTAGTEYDGTNDPDWTAGVKIGLAENGMVYIADVMRDRVTPMKVEAMMRECALRDGIEVPIVIEEEGGGSGKAMADRYVRDVLRGYDVHMYRPTGAKEHYIRPLAAQAEAGNVKLLCADWNEELKLEADTLGQPGRGFHDDQWDAAAKGYHLLTVMQDELKQENAPYVVRDMYQDITNYQEAL